MPRPPPPPPRAPRPLRPAGRPSPAPRPRRAPPEAGEPSRPAAAPPERVYGGLSGDERREQRRARLLETGLELFADEGYANTSIERLCAEAGVSTRNFYEAFAGREALLTAVFDAAVERALGAVMAGLGAADVGPEGAVETALRAYVDFALDDPRRARIIYFETVGVSADLERRRREVIRLFARLIAAQADELAARELLPGHDFSWVALGLVGAANELIVEWLHRQPPPPRQVIADALVGLVMSAIEGARVRARRRDAGP
jgi:AcrR family transcriptional regulator